MKSSFAVLPLSTRRPSADGGPPRPRAPFVAVHLLFHSPLGPDRAAEAGTWIVQRTASTRRASAQLERRERGVTIVLAAERGASAIVRRFVDDVRSTAARAAPDLTITLGVSGTAEDPETVHRAMRQAEVTARIGDMLHGPGSTTAYHELGAYPALYEALHADGSRSAFADLVDAYLGAAVRYERTYGLPILDTLAAYFAQHGNVAATARALGLNRQSLLYRLERFETLSGVDLGSPSERFALELALRCWPIRHARSPSPVDATWERAHAEAT